MTSTRPTRTCSSRSSAPAPKPWTGELWKGKLNWTSYGSGDTVRAPYGALALDDLYRTVDLVATRKTL